MIDQNPKVSVIVPNYNHERFLPQRIESIINQTEQDIEILILDDCSTDNSRQTIEAFALKDRRIRTVFNEKNSGSTFKQWNKGFELARGKYVWIAESDDYADLQFLDTLLACMEKDTKIQLAYCHSWSVDDNSKITHDPSFIYATVDNQQWVNSFVKPGIELVQKYMSFSCIIPNASAAVFHRDLLHKIGPADESMKLAGDWLFWAKALAATHVAFIAKPLNYFRYHDTNVRSKAITSGLGLLEEAKVLYAMQQYGEADKIFVEKKLNYVLQRWFFAMVNYSIPIKRHLEIYRTMSKTHKDFGRRFRIAFSQFLFGNKLSGIRQFIGDRWLLRLKTLKKTNNLSD
jgi:glycosyltransferase involved in cell wall biosynthesis